MAAAAAAHLAARAVSWNPTGDGAAWAYSCDWKGGDISNAVVPAAQCGPKCEATSGCTHFSWSNYNGGTCWMKGGSVSPNDAFSNDAKDGVCGYLKSAQPAVGGWTTVSDCQWAPKCDFKGQDLTSVLAAGSACSSKCAGISGCTHFSWTNANGGTCWMKSGAAGVGDAIVNNAEGAICGIMSSSNPQPPPPPPPGGPYKLVKNHTPKSMLAGDGWYFFTDSDPTHGHVKYVSRNEGISSDMFWTANDDGEYLYMGSKQTGGGPPKSLRLTSVDGFDSGLVIVDALHIPSGCGTWPAFWTVGTNWPNHGEIDFMEGVNGVGNNIMTLHTGPGCSMNLDNQQKSCLGNNGCGTQTSKGATFGDSFNRQRGGVYAMEWVPRQSNGAPGFIKVWNFARNAIPADITNGNPNPGLWPTNDGYAYFGFGNNCQPQTFGTQQIIINLTFCGDWAGGVFANQCSAAAGGRSCPDFVSNVGSALNEAFFKIKGVQLYQLA
ncbi:hypothetical protein HDU78_011080 [Chytriomyces hyalinus]|nr:hypothetical protein HDU78_011080 [Chytriomyces hyalinus]KAJ3263415.1 hypothetical protein HDU77_010709 [Chytriomyces hyalinus]